jgi:hypothetical protein
MSFTTIAEWFNSLLGKIDTNHPRARANYPFALRVGVVQMAAPRHPRFDMVREMGYTTIDDVFKGTPFSETELTFVFPERQMSVHEQQAFMCALLKNPHISQVTSVDILTSSALLISSFQRESILILTWDDDHRHNGNLSGS